MRSLRFVSSALVLALALLAAPGCRSKPLEKSRTGSLSARVGHEQGLGDLSAAFVKTVGSDATVGAKFAAVDKARLERELTAWLCKAVGGSCSFAGTLLDALGGVVLDEDEFASVMEVFIAAMNEVALPTKEQNDLIDLLMKGYEQASAAAPAAAAPVPPG